MNHKETRPFHSFIPKKRLMNMVQGEGQSTDSYRLKFENQADVIQNMRGQLYRDSTLYIVSMDTYNKKYHELTTDSERDTIKAAATETWKASLFIVNSNPTKFDQLKKEMHNDYISGNTDSYPTTFNSTCNRLN
mmetsp:Transcript_5923/g.16609  ORF Transcript_5923/g.16609 Transcript_5923/m.16609 type:complete len:134 (+) Transcript_5923:274-675(+)